MNKNRDKDRTRMLRLKGLRLGRKLLAWMLAAVLAVGAAPMKVSVQATVSGGDAATGNEAEGAEENASGVMGEGERQGESAVLSHAEGDALTGSVDGIVSGSVTWTYDPATKTATVTGTGERSIGYYIVESPFPAETEMVCFKDCVIVGSCSSLFRGLGNLHTIDFTGIDTSNVTNMYAMFWGCSGLTSLDVRGLDTRSVTSMGSMFYGCSGLTSLDVSGLDTRSVTSMGSMFYGCSGLTSLDVSGLDTSSVREMGSMFSGCSNLTSLDVSGFDTGNATSMHGMFSGCSNLTSLDASGLDTGSVTAMGSMFSGCSNLTSLDVNGLDTGNVTDMWFMFSGCSNLTSLDVRGLDTGSATTMRSMFSGCSNLTNLDVSGFDTGSVTDMRSMFSGCSNLTSLDVSGFDTGSVTDMCSMFYGCSGLANLDVSRLDTSSVTDMEAMFYGCSSLTDLDMSGLDTGSVTNMSDMFYGCGSLTDLDMSGLDTGSVANMRYMFYNCSSLTDLDLNGLDTGSVTGMGRMFSGCRSLVSLDLSGLDTGSVTSMYGMFSGCSGLTSLDVSDLDTSSVTDMGSMFSGCRSLTSLDVSSFHTSRVKNMGLMFWGCSSLAALDLSNFDTGNVTEMTGMFCNCKSLADLNLSNFNTVNVVYMNSYKMGGMFEGCSSLTSLDLSGFDIGSVREVSDMFSGCKSLEELIAPWQMCAEPIALPADFVDPEGNTTSVLIAEYAGKKLTRALTAAVAEELPKAVMYAPYEAMLGLEGYGNFSLESGTLPEGLSLAQNGTLSGVPAESGDFTFQVKASGQDVKERLLEYRLAVGQNTDVNVQTYTDEGYELVETVPDLSKEDMPAQGEQTMRSVGAYEEFVALYLDGGKLVRGEGDTLTGDAEYLARPGSTRITILNQTLAKNGSGTHTLAMEFRKTDTGELRRAAQNYTIAEEQEPGPDDDRPGGDEPGDGNDDEPDGDDGTEENGGGDEGGGEDDSAEDDQGDTAAEGGAGLSGDPYESAYYDYEIDWEAVGRMIDAAEPEQSVDVLAGGCLSVPAWILEKCKTRDVILALHVGNGITLGITGEEIKQPETPFEANMVYQAQIPDSEKAALLKDALAGRVFEIAEPTGAGALSCPVNVHFSWGSELAGRRSVLYHYEKESGRMAPVGSFAVTQAGQAMFGLSGSGGYIAVVCEDDAGEAADAGGNGSSGEINDSSNSNSPGKNEAQQVPSKDQEPKTGDAVPIRIYATLAMIAGFTYLLLCFTEGRRGLTEEAKKEAVARLAGWARRGGKFRRMLAFAAIFVLLLYYHGTKNLYCPVKKGTCRLQDNGFSD